MDLALYDPDLGYYASGRAKIGRQGDFYTNVSVGSLFGRLLAGQFREMWHRLGKPSPLRIIEQGAHDGRFAADVLTTLLPDLPLNYTIVEPSPILRDQQKITLAPFLDAVQWVEDLEAIAPCDGIHFSNELIDAMPFHIMQSSQGTWQELRVDNQRGEFVFQPAKTGPDLRSEEQNLPTRPDGTLIELRPGVRSWTDALSRILQTGYILVVDYGFPRQELHASHRREGTFSCYQNHRRDAEPLLAPGEKDITAHVDFSALAEAAMENGFQIEGFTDQHHFLVGAANSLLQSLEGPPTRASQKTLRTLRSLLHPENLGTRFHYLALTKGIPMGEPLAGFRHGRDPESILFG